jgi:hypothetical protein
MTRTHYGPGRPGFRDKLEDYQQIDIRKLTLEPGTTGSLPDDPAIRYFVADDSWIRLSYIYQNGSGIWQSADRDISITYTKQHFGGRRAWFACCTCGKRVAILYNKGPRLGCRTCLNLVYRSQAERYWDRAERMAARVLGKLIDGGDQILKPSRMRWTTFEKLYAQYIDLQEASYDGFLLKVARLLKRAG